MFDIPTAPALSLQVNAGLEPWRSVANRAEDTILDGDVADAARFLAPNRHMLACERAIAEEHVLRRLVESAPGQVDAALDCDRLASPNTHTHTRRHTDSQTHRQNNVQLPCNRTSQVCDTVVL